MNAKGDVVLLPPWLAFTSAGAAFLAASYQWTVLPAYRAIYAEMGVMLPWVTAAMLQHATSFPLALLVAGCLALAATRARLRVELAPVRARALRQLAMTAAIGLCLIAATAVVTNAIAFQESQKALSQ